MGRPKVRTTEVRGDVLRCALDVLEREGPPAVSARRVATAAGTSTAALYEFFGDKTGLVRALYWDGFVALDDALAAADAEREGDPRAALVTLLAAARAFARRRPLLFELMYSRPFAEFTPGPDDVAAGRSVYRRIVGAVRRWLIAQGSSASAREAAHVIIAAHRGFVMTELAGIAGSTPANMDARYRRGVDAILDGLLVGTRR